MKLFSTSTESRLRQPTAAWWCLTILCALLLPLAGLFAQSAAAADQVHERSATGNRFDNAVSAASKRIETLIARESIPGLAVAVVVDGSVAWTQGFGVANIEHRTPVKAATKFRIGSISKPLTMTAIALLMEDGLITLDAPISTYSTVFAGKGRRISVRHLASHRSGLPHYSGDDFIQTTHYDSMTDAMSKYWDRPLLFEPGSRFAYSSFGYNLLGAVVEQVTDKLFVDVVEELITRPLGLDSIVPDRYAAIIEDRTAFYHKGADAVVRNAPPVDNSDLWPGGGYLSNAADLARFGDAVINGGLLEPDTLALLLDPGEPTDDAGNGYALGWSTGTTNARRWVGHSGSHYGCMAHMLVFPDDGIVVVTLANLSAETSDDSGPTQFYELAGAVGESFADR